MSESDNYPKKATDRVVLPPRRRVPLTPAASLTTVPEISSEAVSRPPIRAAVAGSTPPRKAGPVSPPPGISPVAEPTSVGPASPLQAEPPQIEEIPEGSKPEFSASQFPVNLAAPELGAQSLERTLREIRPLAGRESRLAASLALSASLIALGVQVWMLLSIK